MKIVIIGAGMVGSRFADEVHRLDPSVQLNLLGAESYEPYNRILLTELLAGREDLASLMLPAPADAINLRTGERAVRINRAEMTVTTDQGEYRYDHLVLATGAKARVIPIPGLATGEDGGLPRGAYVLRTLDDARDIKAASLNARHAVVIGGGPLGLETACGLRNRGVGVTMLSIMPTLLDTNLDADSAEVLTDAAADLGIEFVGGAQVEAVRVECGQVSGVSLRGGETIAAQLVVLAVGSAPDIGLAAAAGLETDRGIVVGHDLRTSVDANISAIGDCAQTPTGISGLVAPGWAQARGLAKSLIRGTLVEPTPIAGASMRLKADGLDVVTMGRTASSADSHDRVVSLHDGNARRHVDIVVRDETLVGVTCIGAPEIAAHLSTQYDRPGMIPSDPLHLLLGPAAVSSQQASSPTAMPAATTVCRCNGVTKGDLVHAWEGGACTMQDLAERTLATTGCGGCTSLVCGLVEWLTEVDPPTPHQDSQADRALRENSVPAQ